MIKKGIRVTLGEGWRLHLEGLRVTGKITGQRVNAVRDLCVCLYLWRWISELDCVVVIHILFVLSDLYGHLGNNLLSRGGKQLSFWHLQQTESNSTIYLESCFQSSGKVGSIFTVIRGLYQSSPTPEENISLLNAQLCSSISHWLCFCLALGRKDAVGFTDV